MLLRKEHSGSPWHSYQIYVTQSGNKLQMEWLNSGGTIYGTVGTSAIVANQWCHLAYGKQGSNGFFYVNGVNDTSSTSTHTGTLFNSSNPLTIGAVNASSKRLDGQIDDVRLYNRALLVEEITALYNGGAGCQ
jgi:hypothetical protein